MVTLCSELFLGTFFIALLYERVLFSNCLIEFPCIQTLPDLGSIMLLEDLVQVGSEYTCGQLCMSLLKYEICWI